MPQKQHDALAVLLTAAAASGALPTLGGAAPTLVVSVREEDLATGRGYAHLPGDDEPISLAAARHIACTGAVQRVVSRGERQDRVDRDPRPGLQHHQRRAITARDGGCLIPGCHVPPQWCEIHHVEEHSRGGPTHTDNGVLLCWFHHRTIDSGGWRIRMIDGVPHVRGPSWWDAHAKWRPATKSPTRRARRDCSAEVTRRRVRVGRKRFAAAGARCHAAPVRSWSVRYRAGAIRGPRKRRSIPMRLNPAATDAAPAAPASPG